MFRRCWTQYTFVMEFKIFYYICLFFSFFACIHPFLFVFLNSFFYFWIMRLYPMLIWIVLGCYSYRYVKIKRLCHLRGSAEAQAQLPVRDLSRLVIPISNKIDASSPLNLSCIHRVRLWWDWVLGLTEGDWAWVRFVLYLLLNPWPVHEYTRSQDRGLISHFTSQ